MGQHYRDALSTLRARCPDNVDHDRWHQAIADATAFISQWGGEADAFGWTARELFGLHTPPERPPASYQRLARYDETGLIWLLRGRQVIALTENGGHQRRDRRFVLSQAEQAGTGSAGR